MPTPTSPHRFLCMVEGRIAGPFDLIELAAEVRYGHIDANTLVRYEETEDWLALRDLPEFTSIQEVSIDTIARHLEQKERMARGASSTGTISSFPWAIAAYALVFLSLLGLGIYSAFTPQTGKGFQPIADALPPFAFAKQYRAETDTITRVGTATIVIYQDNGKERVEMNSKGRDLILIMRPDIGKAYTILPSRKFVHPTSLDAEAYKEKQSQGALGPDARIEPLYKDAYQDVPCVKYRITAKDHTWFLWVDTTKNVPLGMQEEFGDSRVRYKSYQPGPQDVSLFEAPTDG